MSVELEEPVREGIRAALGAEVRRARSLSGGDINEAYAVTLADGREVFLKTNRRSPPGMFFAEAKGLAWLAAAGALRVPTVLACDQRFLILELLERGQPGPAFDEVLGRGLAELHRATPAPVAPGLPFGLDHDNFIGPLPQSNRAAATWGEFYARARIEPQAKRAADAGKLSASAARGLERLLSKMDALVGPPEPPARLHGDLWGGNLMCDVGGAPCLIDPAVHAGHREVDLAMMRLFGGFSARTFAAYTEAFPLSAGHADRIGLYQLYPLLVHVNLFGGSYLGSVEAALARLV